MGRIFNSKEELRTVVEAVAPIDYTVPMTVEALWMMFDESEKSALLTLSTVMDLKKASEEKIETEADIIALGEKYGVDMSKQMDKIREAMQEQGTETISGQKMGICQGMLLKRDMEQCSDEQRAERIESIKLVIKEILGDREEDAGEIFKDKLTFKQVLNHFFKEELDEGKIEALTESMWRAKNMVSAKTFEGATLLTLHDTLETYVWNKDTKFTCMDDVLAYFKSLEIPESIYGDIKGQEELIETIAEAGEDISSEPVKQGIIQGVQSFIVEHPLLRELRTKRENKMRELVTEYLKTK